MSNPAAFAVERPRVVVLAVIFAVVYGLLTYVDIPRQENPTITNRFISVETYLPGAEPEKVELLVSKVLEDKIAEVDDIHTIFSSSVEGASFLRVEVKKDAPVERRLQQIRLKIQEARQLLPPEATEPDVDDQVLRTNTMVLAITGPELPPVTLKEHAKELKRRLEGLPTIGKVELLGEAREEIEVAVDVSELAHQRIALPEVVHRLSERNALLPAGELDLGGSRSPIEATSLFDDVNEVGATYLTRNSQGVPVQLADVAEIRRRLSDDQPRVRYNGVPAVSLALEMLPNHNVVAVGAQVRSFVAGFDAQAGAGLRTYVVADEPTYVAARIQLLTDNLLLGLVLVIVFTFLALGFRSGFVVSMTIPISMVVALGLMGTLGVPLHQISIGALVIALGLVVDESIVVVDNIQRHIERGTPARQAAVDGLGEIHLAVIAGAVTTIAAFVPLALMTGDIGDFIRAIPIAVTLMLVASVVTAHFVTPLLLAFVHGWDSRREVVRVKTHRVEALYRRFLQATVYRVRWVLLVFAGAFVAALFAISAFLWPPDFFSDADRNQFLVELYLPSGTAVEETDRVMARLESWLSEQGEVRDYAAFIGAGAPKFYYNQFTERRGENVGMFIVNTHPGISPLALRTLVEHFGASMQRRAPSAFVRAVVLKQGYSGGRDIEIFIQGDDFDVLRMLATRVRSIAQDIEGVAATSDSFGYDPVTVEARVDPGRANLYDISHRDIAITLQTAMEGTVATWFREADEEIPIVVRVPMRQRDEIHDLESLPFVSPTTDAVIPLAQIAELVPGFTTQQIPRWRRKREAFVGLDVSGRPLYAVAQEVQGAVTDQVSMPEGYEISFFGQQAEVNESFASLARATVIAVFLIYIVLVIRFQSLTQPMLIVLAIPMALIGSTWGLVLSGNPLSFTAFLGMISLTGIVVNDSIVLMDYINTLRKRGTPLAEAVVEGASTRLRAVTLTSVTTIAGLLPLSIAGGTFFGPFGFAMIGGLVASTVLTLLVQPAAYLALERRRKRSWDASVPDAASVG